MTDQNSLDDLLIPGYMQGYEPFQITISGRLPESPDDGSGRVFVMPYPTFKAAINKTIMEARLDELSKVWSGMDTAGTIRDGGYSARNLNLDDLSYWLHNRRRVLQGKKALTPEEWLEAER